MAGVSPEKADIDACRIEHVVSASTIQGIKAFLKRENVLPDNTIDSSHLPEIRELNESGENYIEHIYMMTRDGKRVRSTDLAKSMEVSRASISRAMDVLTNLGLLNRGEKGDLILTPAGEEKARSIYAFRRDNTHIHHRLMQGGMGPLSVLFVILLLTLIFVGLNGVGVWLGWNLSVLLVTDISIWLVSQVVISYYKNTYRDQQ